MFPSIVPYGIRSCGKHMFPEEYMAFTEEDFAKQRKAADDLVLSLKKNLAPGKTAFRIPAGYYRFSRPLELSNLSDVTLEAQPGTFFIGEQGSNMVLHLHRCERVTVKGLRIDHDRLTFAQCTLYDYAPDEGKILVTVDENYLPFFLTLEKEMNGCIYRLLYYRKDANEVQIPLSAHANGALAGITRAGELEDGTVLFRLHMDRNIHKTLRPDLSVGDKVVIPAPRGAACVLLEDCHACTLEDISIYSSSAFVISDHFGKGANTYRNVRIGRLPGTDRLLAGCSDGLHVIGCENGPLVEDCDFSYVCDDSFNCHNFIGMTISRLSEDEYVILFPMKTLLSEGGEFSFFRYRNYESLGGAAVVSFERLLQGPWFDRMGTYRDAFIAATGFPLIRTFDEPYLYRVKLDRPVCLEDFTGISSYANSNRGLTIRHCRFHDLNGNGIVSRSNGVVLEDNTLARINNGICISGGGNWTEGPIPRKVVIRNNLLEDVCQSFESFVLAPGAVAVFPAPYSDEPIRNTGLIRDVLIEGNRFLHCNGTTLYARNIQNLIFRDNLTDHPMDHTNPLYARAGRPSYALYEMENCRDAVLENNTEKNLGSLLTSVLSEK